MISPLWLNFTYYIMEWLNLIINPHTHWSLTVTDNTQIFTEKLRNPYQIAQKYLVKPIIWTI